MGVWPMFIYSIINRFFSFTLKGLSLKALWVERIMYRFSDEYIVSVWFVTSFWVLVY